MTPRQAAQLADLRLYHPKVMRIFERVYSSARPSRADSLRAKCLDCCCFQVTEAAQCSSELCPLHSINPYRAKRKKRQNAPSLETP